jgi:hypothetical protein
MAPLQLLTPEEPLAHTFEHTKPAGPIQTASPPDSPAFKSFSTDPGFCQPDAVLYPHTGVPIPDDKPLFDPNEPSFITTKSFTPVTKVRKQRPEPVGVVQLYNHYGVQYRDYIMAQNEELYKAIKAGRQLPPLPPKRANRRDTHSEQQLALLGRVRVEKTRAPLPASPKVSQPRIVPSKVVVVQETTSPAPRLREAATKRHRRQTSTPEAAGHGVGQVKPRTRNPPSKKIEDNSPWHEIPDRCPPVDSLDKMHKKMVVKWNNTNHMDLSKDVDRQHLHPQELEVASTLRLDCKSYLASKRRIINARIDFLREGKDFRKTSAQNSVRIDVNKTSKLWEAFNEIGWFDEHWYQQYL